MLLENPRPAGARWCAPGLALLLGWLASGCLVDLDDRCGPHQRYDSEQASCVCDGDYALSGNVCAACAENELGSPAGCVCAPGFVRVSPEAPCAEQAGLDQACSSDEQCSDPSYSYCRVEPDAEVGYCTAPDCASSDECPTDFACNTREAKSFCEHPPTGLGQACSSSDDCEGNQASYCETVVAKSCVVNDCAPDPNRCYGDWLCCDIGLLGQSLCIPPSELEDGNCPAGGTLVPREQ